MGRSSQQKAAENRQKIVDCACDLFRQHGVDNVSIAQIMNANEMTVGGFYKHFASKDELIEEVFSRTFQQSASTWQKVFGEADAKGDPRTGTLARQYLKNKAPNRRCPILAFSTHVSVGEAAAPSVEIYVEGVKQLYELFVGQEAAAPAAQTTRPDSDQAARVLFAAMIGARLLQQSVGDAPWIKDIQEAIRAM